MTAATWILAIATLALAVEGGTAVLKYIRVRPGSTRRDIEAMQREIALLHHAAWMDVSGENQGSRTDVDDKVRAMLMRCWRPDLTPSRPATST